MDLCANCRSKVDAGAVRCTNCGSDLYLPGAFLQLVGWVMIGVSTIPLSMSVATIPEGDYLPLIPVAVLIASGSVLVVIAKIRNRGAQPRVIREE
jgi:hypothetical protein